MLTGSCSQRAPRSPVGHNSETNGPQLVTCGGGVQPCLAWLVYLLNQETDFLCRGLELMKVDLGPLFQTAEDLSHRSCQFLSLHLSHERGIGSGQ